MKNKRILVTGGNGFLGKEIVMLLIKDNTVFAPTSSEFDLTQENDVKSMFEKYNDLDIVIHAAADVGGIGYSSTYSAKQFYNNTLINLYVHHYSYLFNVSKFVGVGSVCEYPADTPIPFVESEIWNGYPVITNDAYGLTKRMLLAQSIIYNRDYNFNSIHLLPVNLYGPGDKFSEKVSHVIPAMIRKIQYAIDNNEENVSVWGTGDESREFIYVSDAAEAIVMATENYSSVEPINIGSGYEIKIKDLCVTLAQIMKFNGKFIFENNGLGGQKRRQLDVSKAFSAFGFSSSTTFIEGLTKTVQYYLEHIHKK